MDFLEKYFKNIWKTERQKKLISTSSCHLKSIETYIETILSFGNNSKESFILKSTLQSVGVTENQIFLPEFIDYFKSTNKNKKIYLYLAMQAVALCRISKDHWLFFDSKIANRLFFLSQSHLINQWLDKQFDFFNSFQHDFIDEIQSKKIASNNLTLFWKNRVLARHPMNANEEIHFKTLLSLQKRNDKVPDFLQMTTASYLGEGESFVGSQEGEIKKRKSEKKEEQESQRGSLPKKQELDKKKNNPVTHSFEKLETVDEYEGGDRFDSGDDELEKHKDALDEIELNNVTLDGESSNSIYKTDSHLSGQVSGQLNKIKKKTLYYPEWNEKKSLYIDDYCTLNVSKMSDSLPSNQKQLLKSKYHKEIVVWKKRLSYLFNKPLWQNHLFEGDEIDMDRWSRTVADLSAQQTPQYNVYSMKKMKQKDIAIAVLFDQSLSTDSWIENNRVIDVICESLGVAGLLLEDMTHQILIASTYSATHNNCQLQIYKDFKDPWSLFY